MIREIFASYCARILRASLVRMAGDLELGMKLHVSMSSAAIVAERMATAVALNTRDEVLQYAMTSAELEGMICEFGVFEGGTLNRIAEHFSDQPVFGFDTFGGLPENWRADFKKGAFKTDLGTLKFMSNCEIFPGLFSETLPDFLKSHGAPAKLIHIDCDLYRSTQDILFNLGRARIVSGTIIVFDEYLNYPGWQNHEFKAFDEFLSWKAGEFEYLAYNRGGEQVAVRVC